MYRQSDSNYFIPYGDKMIYFNGLTRNSFAMNLAEHERMQLQFADPISFELSYPSIFSQFKKWGFFVREGNDEIAMFRFLYNKNVLFSQNVHIVININEEIHSIGDYLGRMKRHLNAVFGEIHPSLLCIEWTGMAILTCLDEVIIPLSRYASSLCGKYQIEYQSQLAVRMEFNESIHDKLHHRKGIPTYKRMIRQVEELCRSTLGITIGLLVGYAAEEEDRLEQFTSYFSEDVREHILFNWEKKNYQIERLSKSSGGIWQNNDFPVLGEAWYALKYPRIWQYSVSDNGMIYSGRIGNRNHPWGEMNEDGLIVWDEERRMQLLGQPWFETDKCRQCKHLFLFAPYCSQVCVKSICCLENNLLVPEKIVIEEFESKNV